MIDAIPTMAWSSRPDGFIEFVNRRWLDFTGLSLDQALGWSCNAGFHPDDGGPLADKWRALVASGQAGEIEARMRRHDGEYRWFLLRAEPLRDEQGKIIKWYGVNIDIEDRKRTESLRAAETRTLEMIANGAPLVDIIKSLCDTIDDQSPKIISTVMLMDADGTRLWPVPGRRVPPGWLKAIIPVPLGPNLGTCVNAVLLKQRVIAPDLDSDSVRPPYYDLALANGIRASWSQPLLSRNQEVLGTFAMFYAEPRVPSDSDLRLIEGAAHVAVIAIEGARSQDALKKAFGQLAKSEAELRTIIDAIPQLIAVLGPDGDNLYANQAVLEYTGLTRDEVMDGTFRDRVFHPEDVERLRDERQAALSRELPFENEQRARRRDGQYRWFLIQYRPLRNEQGDVIRWYATGTDIDDRKQAEERTRRENLALREEIDHSSMFEEIVGSSEALRQVLRQLAKVAPTDSTVLISGETGTGKELIARAIHKRSNRSTRAFIVVNCAAIPQSLIASELFGHEKGAFTSALQRRTGRFEAADGGTIFLDEIGELPIEMQVALLRVLQEREFERVGGSESIKVNVRVLAATNRDLQRAVSAGSFRQDLFYRLNVFPIRVPPLRERAGDVPILVEYLIDRYAKKAGRKFTGMAKRTLELFRAYNWPGNIRELQNVIERAVVLCESETFSVDESWLKRAATSKTGPALPLSATLIERERELIEAALAQSRGRVSGPLGAAAKLGIPRQTLESKISNLGIDKNRFRTASAPA
jgi:formate hydrogenlyase transcriptional activator